MRISDPRGQAPQAPMPNSPLEGKPLPSASILLQQENQTPTPMSHYQ